MILIVDMNWKKNSLAFDEFVSPIISIIEPVEDYTVKHFSEVESLDLSRFEKIVLSGTALRDFSTLKQLDKFNWVKTYPNPILGICAGIQTISLLLEETLLECLKIGMTQITTTNKNPLFEGDFEAYALHTFSVLPSPTIIPLAKSQNCIEAIKHKDKDIYGVFFHPEVRNPEIIKRFIDLNL